MKDGNQDFCRLSELGIKFESKKDYETFARIIEKHLRMRVGERLTRNVSDEKLDEFDLVARHSDDKALRWLEENCPDYREVCYRTRDEIRREILAYKEVIPGLVNAEKGAEWNEGDGTVI